MKKKNIGKHFKNWARNLIMNCKSKKKYLSKHRKRRKKQSKEKWSLFKKNFKNITIVKK